MKVRSTRTEFNNQVTLSAWSKMAILNLFGFRPLYSLKINEEPKEILFMWVIAIESLKQLIH